MVLYYNYKRIAHKSHILPPTLESVCMKIDKFGINL